MRIQYFAMLAPASPLPLTYAPSAAGAQHALDTLPPAVERMLWRGTELGRVAEDNTCTTGWPSLDSELPGCGWPQGALTEVLTAQPGTLEWRLLAPALKQVVAADKQVLVIGPPKVPHLPGLLHAGLDERHFVWIKAEAPAERLWTTEQIIKSGAAGALLAWLPQARQEQIRRLQVCAQGTQALVFLMRPATARSEASAAPLRIQAGLTLDWQVTVEVFKRRGPAHDGLLTLDSIPGGLAPVLTPRLLKPSALFTREAPDVVGSPSTVTRRQRATA